MIKHMPISETRKRITHLASELSPEDTVSVTNRGKEILAILPWETYEAIAETLQILSDPRMMEQLKNGLDDIKNERLHDLDEVKRDLGLV